MGKNMPDHHDPFDPFGGDSSDNVFVVRGGTGTTNGTTSSMIDEDGFALTTLKSLVVSSSSSSTDDDGFVQTNDENDDNDDDGDFSEGDGDNVVDDVATNGGKQSRSGSRDRSKSRTRRRKDYTESPADRAKSRSVSRRRRKTRSPSERSKSRSPSRRRNRSTSPTRGCDGQSRSPTSRSRSTLGCSSSHQRKGKRPSKSSASSSSGTSTKGDPSKNPTVTKSPGSSAAVDRMVKSPASRSGGDKAIPKTSNHRGGRRSSTTTSSTSPSSSRPSSSKGTRRGRKQSYSSSDDADNDSISDQDEEKEGAGCSGDELNGSRHNHHRQPTTPKTPTLKLGRDQIVSPSGGSSSGGSASFGESPRSRQKIEKTTTPKKPRSSRSNMASSGTKEQKKSQSPWNNRAGTSKSVSSKQPSQPKVNYNDASVWELRSRFQREFPDDLLPSDVVLRTLYSPDKIAALDRRDRFQKEHPNEPIPSDEVLKRLYNVVPSTPAIVSAPPMMAATTTTEMDVDTPPPILQVQAINRRDMMVRQDSGLTFATEAEWEEWKKTTSTGKNSSRGLGSSRGNDIFGSPGKMHGIAEDQEEDDDDANDKMDRPQFNDGSCDGPTPISFHNSFMEYPSSSSTTRKNNNPSLDVLKIGKNTDGNRKSSSQSLGSGNDKSRNRSVMSGSKSTHSRTIFSNPSASLSMSVHGGGGGGGGGGGTRRSTADNSNTGGASLLLSRSTHSSTNHTRTSSSAFSTGKSTMIDLLNVPTDHFYEKGRPNDADFQVATGALLNHVNTMHTGSGKNNTTQYAEQQELQQRPQQQQRLTTATDFDPFQEEEEEDLEHLGHEDEDKPRSQTSIFDDPFSGSGNDSFGSMNSRGERQKKRSSGKQNCSSTKDGKIRTRKSSSSNGSSSGGKKISISEEGPERQLSRTSSGMRTKSKTSGGSSSTSGKPSASRGVSRAKSDSLNLQKVPSSGNKKRTKLKKTKSETKGFGGGGGGGGGGTGGGFDFDCPPSFDFDVTPNAFNDNNNNNRGNNKAEKSRRDTIMDELETDIVVPAATEGGNVGAERDFFDVPASAWGNVASTHAIPPSKKEQRPPRSSRRLNAQAAGGWMSDMPGHVRQGQQQQQEGGTSEGFELHVRATADAISPLTAYTKKPVRPMIRNRW